MRLTAVEDVFRDEAGLRILKGTFQRYMSGETFTAYYDETKDELSVYTAPKEAKGIRLECEIPGTFRYDGKVIPEREFNAMYRQMKGEKKNVKEK